MDRLTYKERFVQELIKLLDETPSADDMEYYTAIAEEYWNNFQLFVKDAKLFSEFEFTPDPEDDAQEEIKLWEDTLKEEGEF